MSDNQHGKTSTRKELAVETGGGVLSNFFNENAKAIATYLGVPSLITLISTLIQYLQGMPYGIKGLILAFVVPFFIVGFVWLLVRRKRNQQSIEYTHSQQLPHSPINISVNPVISPTFNNAPQIKQQLVTHQQVISESYNEPIFECRGLRIETVSVHSVFNTILCEGELAYPSHDFGFCDAVFVKFYYKPDKNVFPHMKVTGHIHFKSKGSSREILDTVWYKHDDTIKTFYTSNSHELVIALIGKNRTDEIVGYEYEYKEYHVEPNIYPIRGNVFHIKVELIGKYNGQVEMQNSFYYVLTLTPELSFIESTRTDFENFKI